MCAVCNKDLSNKLALVKKYGAGKVKYQIAPCCGKIICYQCRPPFSRDFTTVLKQMTEKAEKGGGPSVLDVQLPGPAMCPNCNYVAKGNLTERQKFKWNEKFAAEGIPWWVNFLLILNFFLFLQGDQTYSSFFSYLSSSSSSFVT